MVQRHVAIHTKIQKRKRAKRLAAKESSQAKDHLPKPRQQQLFADGDLDQRLQESLLIENTIRQVSLANRMLRPGILRDPLPGGRIDPFCALYIPVENTRDLELLDYLTNVIWPGFSEYGSDGALSPFATRWLRRGAKNPALLHAFLMSSSSHLKAQLLAWNKNPKVIAEQIYHENEAIRLVRHQLDNLESTDISEILMIIVSLATNRCRQVTTLPLDPTPFNPPLRSANWINVYGTCDFSWVHWNALLKLIENVGGFSRIGSYGLSLGISFVDLLQAAAAMRRLCYPIVSPQGRMLSFERLESFAQAFDLSNESARRGPGFSYLNVRP